MTSIWIICIQHTQLETHGKAQVELKLETHGKAQVELKLKTHGKAQVDPSVIMEIFLHWTPLALRM
jgi:hypothetical protein